MEQGGGPRSSELAQADRPLPVGVFGRGQGIQTAVWPELVVTLPPGFDQMARVGEPEEKMFVETYMDPTSAQGCLVMLGIGCSHCAEDPG